MGVAVKLQGFLQVSLRLSVCLSSYWGQSLLFVLQPAETHSSTSLLSFPPLPPPPVPSTAPRGTNMAAPQLIAVVVRQLICRVRSTDRLGENEPLGTGRYILHLVLVTVLFLNKALWLSNNKYSYRGFFSDLSSHTGPVPSSNALNPDVSVKQSVKHQS